VPLVVHVHGAEGVADNSDGYSEAWYMPDATNLAGYATVSFRLVHQRSTRSSSTCSRSFAFCLVNNISTKLLLLFLLLLQIAVQNGTWYETLRAAAQTANPGSLFGPGVATYTYPVTQRPTQTWYHDHV
jgi:hypothetical protein